MNVELKPRVDLSFLAPASAPANDNVERGREGSLARRRAVIYKPVKSAMTSGRAGTNRWLLEYEPQSAPFIEPLMGWTGSTDPTAHMQMSFSSREAAVAYAQRQGLDYEIREPAGKSAGTAKARKPVNRPLPQAMMMWPVELLHAEWGLQVSSGDMSYGQFPEISRTGPCPSLAA